MEQTKIEQTDLVISEILDRYLQEIYKYKYLKAEQLTRLCHKMGMKTTVYARLRKLVAAKYLCVVQIPTNKTKSPYFYVVIGKGLKHLREQDGIDADIYYKPSEVKERSHAFLWHVSELNDFLVAANRVCDVNPLFRLHSFQHDLEMKRHPMKVRIAGSGQREREILLWADAWLDFRMDKGNGKYEQYCYWHEQDRATESEKKFKDKITKIVVAMRSGAALTYFGVRHISGITFATTGKQSRVEAMRKWTMEQLAALGVAHEFGDLFLFTSQPVEASDIDIQQLFFENTWLLAVKDAEPVALLEV